MTIGLLPGLPCNHPGGSTNTLRFGGRSESGGYESELRAPLCHCLVAFLLPVIIKYTAHAGQRKTNKKVPVLSFVSPSFSFFHFSPVFSRNTSRHTKSYKKKLFAGPRATPKCIPPNRARISGLQSRRGAFSAIFFCKSVNFITNIRNQLS
jgi:hypothetical protein